MNGQTFSPKFSKARKKLPPPLPPPPPICSDVRVWKQHEDETGTDKSAQTFEKIIPSLSRPGVEPALVAFIGLPTQRLRFPLVS